MRRLAKAGVAGILLAAATTSASAIEVWQGNLFITVANPACAGNWTANQFFTAVYRPAGLSDNGPNTLLALFGQRTAMSYAVEGALSGNGTYTGRRFLSSAFFTFWENGTYSQATVTKIAKTVLVKVRLKKFGNSGDCTVTLQGSLGKRPDL
jgi:hypothetical protein